MYILRTAYTYLPTGDRYEYKVTFDKESDANLSLKTAFEAADALMENEVADEYEIELIYMKTVYETKVRREDL